MRRIWVPTTCHRQSSWSAIRYGHWLDTYLAMVSGRFGPKETDGPHTFTNFESDIVPVYNWHTISGRVLIERLIWWDWTDCSPMVSTGGGGNAEAIVGYSNVIRGTKPNLRSSQELMMDAPRGSSRKIEELESKVVIQQDREWALDRFSPCRLRRLKIQSCRYRTHHPS